MSAKLIPPTPTTTNSTPAPRSAASARVKPLAVCDTLGVSHFPREELMLPERPEHPGLVRTRAIPTLLLKPSCERDQSLGHPESPVEVVLSAKVGNWCRAVGTRVAFQL